MKCRGAPTFYRTLTRRLLGVYLGADAASDMQKVDQWICPNALDSRGRAQKTHGVPCTDLNCLLSPRELEVLRLVAAGASNAQVAGDLALSVHTVKKHVAKLLLKLKVDSRDGSYLGRVN